jgi:hypothetical protein
MDHEYLLEAFHTPAKNCTILIRVAKSKPHLLVANRPIMDIRLYRR